MIPDLSSSAQIAIPALETVVVRPETVKEERKEKKDDSKTPSEYALHILFTQVSTGSDGRRSERTQKAVVSEDRRSERIPLRQVLWCYGWLDEVKFHTRLRWLGGMNKVAL